MDDHPIYSLRQACYDCRDCPLGNRLVNGLDPHVFAGGNIHASIMFVGEAPGAEEVRQKRPLVGRSGWFYENHILAGAGLFRRSVYTTNAVLCRPDEKNRTPNSSEIDACRRHLDAQVLFVRPKLIVTLGNAPLYALCGIGGITKYRGKLRNSNPWSDGSITKVFPMFHPAYCLRGSGLKETKEDYEALGRMALEFEQSIAGKEDVRCVQELYRVAEEGKGNGRA